MVIKNSNKIYRIKKDLNVYESSNGKSWKKSSMKFPEAIEVIKAFQKHKKLKELIDKKNPDFLKGQFSNKKVQGARINILPNGKKLDKAFSLFSPKLALHDESSLSHWDVVYQNPNRQLAYVYTLEKDANSKKSKYKKVNDFEKILPCLNCNLKKYLGKEAIALPMIVLLKTCMRVGNEIYYKQHHHKGLTTLKKKDISIKNNFVTFDYIAKDGVPQKITEEFPEKVILELKKLLSKKSNHDFVFTNSNNHPYKDTEFKKAFKKFCGKEFYPHIVRSYYATKSVKDFLKKNKHPTKEKTKELYTSIAEKLGHKKFSKKKNCWEDSFQVTIAHYISPELVTRLNSIAI